MKDTKVKIIVPYLTDLNISISNDDAIRLLDLIKNTDMKLSTCIKSYFNSELTIDAHNSASIDAHNSASVASIHSELKILGMANMEKTICQPAKGKQVYTQSRLDKSKRCFYNLQCGKCQDEYVRRTVGAVLFPQIYANEKQK